MIDIILIHGAWWLFGFMCGACAMGALVLAGTIGQAEDEPEPKPKPALKP